MLCLQRHDIDIHLSQRKTTKTLTDDCEVTVAAGAVARFQSSCKNGQMTPSAEKSSIVGGGNGFMLMQGKELRYYGKVVVVTSDRSIIELHNLKQGLRMEVCKVKVSDASS